MAGGIITTKGFPLQLRKDLDEMYKTTLMETPSEFDKIFNVKSAPSKGTYVSRAEITGIGLPGRIAEGEGVAYDKPVEGFEKNRTWEEYGLGYIVTQRMLDDEMFDKIKQMAPALAKSMKVFMDISALQVLNEGETATNGDHAVAKDGLALYGTHNLLNDVIGDYGAGISNRAAVGADLSETTFKAALEYYDTLVDENGYPVLLDPSMLIVGTDDRFIAQQLKTQQFGSVYDLARTDTAGAGNPGTANLNQANPGNGFVKPWDIFVSRYLDDGRWFLNSKQGDEGLTWSWKYQPKMDTYQDDDTRNYITRSLMRFGRWANEWRGTYGNIQ